MKKNFTLIFTIMLCLFYTKGNTQTQFWSDTFEDTGAPSSGVRVPSIEFSCGVPATAYFFRTTPAGIVLNSLIAPNTSYTNFQGNKIWAGEDLDRGTSCTNASAPANQQVTWPNISIAGKSGISFKGFFAANDQNMWQGPDSGDQQDYVIVEYQIDGGAWTKLLAFYASAADESQSLKLETTGDLIGDGTALSYNFGEFTANIPGTGTTLQIRLNAFANGGQTQEFAIDNFRLFETPACTSPVVTTNPPNRSICNGNNTNFSIVATGATATKWQVDQTGLGTYTDITNGGVYSGATTTTLTITGATGAMTGYRYRAVAINGVPTCFANSNFATLNVSNITLTGAQDNIACPGTATGRASVFPTGGIGNYTYSWSPSGGTGAIASNLAVGTHIVTVRDQIGCETTKTFTITETGIPIVITPTQTPSCIGTSNGTASVSVSGGAGNFTYTWSHSAETTAGVSGLAPGTYTVTVTDANLCTKQQSFTIVSSTEITTGVTNQSNVSCNGGSNGTATVIASGGSGTYTYSWSPSGGTAAMASGLVAGPYTVTVTDGNGCSKQQIVTIQPATEIVITPSQTPSCIGNPNGTATVSVSGGAGSYTYSWSPSGGTDATATGLTPGDYSVNVTDANGCSKDQSFTITSASQITTSASQTDVSCNGGSDGIATVTASGGTGGYTYSWSPTGGNANEATGLTQGAYTVTVTDSNYCTTTQNFIIIEPTASILSITRSGNILTADQAGATYQWFTCPGTDIIGEVGQSFTPTANGSYGVAITLNGCTVLAPCVNVTSLATVDFEEKSKFMIYPNPSQGIVNIKSDHDTDVSIINQSGQVVKTAKVTADNTNTINVENLSDGIYFIREMKGNKPATYKLILKK
ncbi:T9SS type A sorting domain-containing protein [Flavobacterium branchiarum]|uniref:T9SS type A sorting domain-containing protein n=1 Tax=Flavobacterium branchiarum TaxID=1114870 RepID=A0ABV5FP68_9FLAO|nr:T9SS type A sorting domain-containing protein [Flavobacterium branchiarum]MDN3674398.1 T9SS type A sorting domain-containing protein [Flavobacterium branchiarum]